MTTQEEYPPKPLQHHFAVFGQRNDDGTFSFVADDGTNVADLISGGIYDPNTEEWLSEIARIEDLCAEQLAIRDALDRLFASSVCTEDVIMHRRPDAQIGDDA
jgi:hypothetical protein